MYFRKDDWIPFIKFYLEVRPSCLFYLFVTVLEYFSYRPLKVLEDLKSLGLRVEDVPAFMSAFLESGQTIHLLGVKKVEDLERTMRFLEEMYTKDEIQWCVLQQYLKDLKDIRWYCDFRYYAPNDKHIAHVSDWASRLGFKEIVGGIQDKTIFIPRWENDIELSESESVSSECEDI
jgi:hypothetical protein